MEVELTATLEYVTAALLVRAVRRPGRCAVSSGEEGCEEGCVTYRRNLRRRTLLSLSNSLINLGGVGISIHVAAEQHPPSGQLARARVDAVARGADTAEKADDELQRA